MSTTSPSSHTLHVSMNHSWIASTNTRPFFVIRKSKFQCILSKSYILFRIFYSFFYRVYFRNSNDLLKIPNAYCHRLFMFRRRKNSIISADRSKQKSKYGTDKCHLDVIKFQNWQYFWQKTTKTFCSTIHGCVGLDVYFTYFRTKMIKIICGPTNVWPD